MFVVFISVLSLIISLFVVNVLYNMINKFVYSTVRLVVSDFGSVQYVLIGILLVILCLLEYDLAYGLVSWLG